MHKSCDPNNCDNCGQCENPERNVMQQADAIMDSLLLSSNEDLTSHINGKSDLPKNAASVVTDISNTTQVGLVKY